MQLMDIIVFGLEQVHQQKDFASHQVVTLVSDPIVQVVPDSEYMRMELINYYSSGEVV